MLPFTAGLLAVPPLPATVAVGMTLAASSNAEICRSVDGTLAGPQIYYTDHTHLFLAWRLAFVKQPLLPDFNATAPPVYKKDLGTKLTSKKITQNST